jgi:alpha-L-fucosidase 2
VSLERRLKAGGAGTGWSRAWVINQWARHEEGDLAHENLLALLKKSTSINLFDFCPPFQMDGNFGGAAGIAEMLLQSHAGELSLLPALPKAWADGEFRGLRARGNVEVNISWRGGKATSAMLRPTFDREVKVRVPRGQILSSIELAGKVVPVTTSPDGTASLQLRGGREYSLQIG